MAILEQHQLEFANRCKAFETKAQLALVPLESLQQQINEDLAQVGEPMRNDLFRELLRIDVIYRWKSDTPPEPEVYTKLFPDNGKLIENAFALAAGQGSIPGKKKGSGKTAIKA